MKGLMIAMIATTMIAPVEMRCDMYSGGQVYDVWAQPGLHLAMSDNGTPDDFDDDWVIDWETNRDIIVLILDH